MRAPGSRCTSKGGLPADQSAVSIFAGLSPTQVFNPEANEPEGILASFADAMFAAGPGQDEIVVVLCPEHVGHMRSAGWSKAQVKDSLFQIAQRKVSEWASKGARFGDLSAGDTETVSPVAQSPDSITVIVAGAFSDIIPLWGDGSDSRSVTWPIRIP